jgi:hypothetical protein
MLNLLLWPGPGRATRRIGRGPPVPRPKRATGACCREFIKLTLDITQMQIRDELNLDHFFVDKRWAGSKSYEEEQLCDHYLLQTISVIFKNELI